MISQYIISYLNLMKGICEKNSISFYWFKYKALYLLIRLSSHEKKATKNGEKRYFKWFLIGWVSESLSYTTGLGSAFCLLPISVFYLSTYIWCKFSSYVIKSNNFCILMLASHIKFRLFKYMRRELCNKLKAVWICFSKINFTAAF